MKLLLIGWKRTAAALFALGGLAGVAAAFMHERTAPSGLGSVNRCRAYTGVPEGFQQDSRAGMSRIPSGVLQLGIGPGERLGDRVRVDAFWIDRTEVTNAQFEAFIKATGYVTEAERQGGAAVFNAAVDHASFAPESRWSFVKGANWRHPEGPGSELGGRWNMPIVQVTLADARAYADWLGHELPSEAQWEWAARGGGEPERIVREPRNPDGTPAANFWQGHFPYMNTREDGFAAHAPVGCFPANGYGTHDMIGNVWEWTRDAYSGPLSPTPSGLIMGGSFLCSSDYCTRYRASARHLQERALAAVHVGFRTVVREP